MLRLIEVSFSERIVNMTKEHDKNLIELNHQIHRMTLNPLIHREKSRSEFKGDFEHQVNFTGLITLYIDRFIHPKHTYTN